MPHTQAPTEHHHVGLKKQTKERRKQKGITMEVSGVMAFERRAWRVLIVPVFIDVIVLEKSDLDFQFFLLFRFGLFEIKYVLFLQAEILIAN